MEREVSVGKRREGRGGEGSEEMNRGEIRGGMDSKEVGEEISEMREGMRGLGLQRG